MAMGYEPSPKQKLKRTSDYEDVELLPVLRRREQPEAERVQGAAIATPSEQGEALSDEDDGENVYRYSLVSR